MIKLIQKFLPIFLTVILTVSVSNVFAQYSESTQQKIEEYNKIIHSAGSSKIEKADAYNGLGFVYRLNFDFQLAIEAHQNSLDLFLKIENIWGQAITNSYIGYVYSAKKNYTMALDYLQYSYKLFYQNDYKEDAVDVLIQIAGVHSLKYDYTKSQEYYNKAITLSLKINYENGQAIALNGIAWDYQNQGNLPKALEYYEKSLAIHKQTKNEQGIAQSLVAIGWIYVEQGNYYRGISCAKESLTLFSANYNSSGEASALNLIGVGFYELQMYDIALKYYQRGLKKALSIDDKYGIATGYHNSAAVYFRQKNLTQALKYFKLAEQTYDELGDKYSQTVSTSDIGVTYFNMDNYEQATIFAKRAEKMAYEHGSPRLIKMCKKLLFNMSVKQGDLIAAEKYGLEINELNDESIGINFPTMSEDEREKFFQSVNKQYMEFNLFVLARKKDNPALTAEVFNNTLQHKGLSLKSSTAMRNAIFESNDSTLIGQFESWIALKIEISNASAAGEDITERENRANELEKILVKESQEFSDFDKIQNLTWLDVQKNLKTGDAAIEFIHFNQFDPYGYATDEVIYCALVVTPTSIYPEMIQLCSEKDLEKLLGTFGGNNLNYINGIYGTENSPNSNLYELIWKPLVPYLDSAKTIYLSPSGLLHRVSFAAISSTSTNETNQKSILLCDIYQLEIQSSTSKIAMSEKYILEDNLHLTLFGGIDYNAENTEKKIWSFLEGTKLEVENISQLFSATSFSILQLKTETEFKENAPKSDIIHMSTHGFFYPDPEKLTTSFEVDTNETSEEDLVFRGTRTSFGVNNFVFNKNPLMRSGLVLSGANRVWNNPDMKGEEDGVLTAYEVAQIDLRHTGLVVLSACETGLGDINGSEGVYGLQRAFKMAGVKYIIMSLWQVPDKETQEFMTLFYKNLLLLKEPKHAFVKTQLVMRKKYDPYYWAAFVLIE